MLSFLILDLNHEDCRAIVVFGAGSYAPSALLLLLLSALSCLQLFLTVVLAPAPATHLETLRREHLNVEVCRAPAATHQDDFVCSTIMTAVDQPQISRICLSSQLAIARSSLPNYEVDVCRACEVSHGTQGHSSRLVHCVVIVVDAALRAYIYRHGRSHTSVCFFRAVWFTLAAVHSHQLTYVGVQATHMHSTGAPVLPPGFGELFSAVWNESTIGDTLKRCLRSSICISSLETPEQAVL